MRARIVGVDASAPADQLRASIDTVSSLRVGEQDLSEVVSRVAEAALSALPNAQAAGILLTEADERVAAPIGFVAQAPLMEVAAELASADRNPVDGPGTVVVAHRQLVRSGALGADPRWPRFAGRVARLGVHSVIGLPLVTRDDVVGRLTFYARDRDAFASDDVARAAAFSAPAAVALHNARTFDVARRLNVDLAAALTSRATIERSIGIIMSHSGCDPDEALERLRRISQRDKVKLREVSRNIVDDAVRRARGRRPSAPSDADASI